MQDKNANSRFGIDINQFTQNVDFRILATKVDFLYLRSSGSGTGSFRVDTKFLEFAKGSRDFGIPVGAYHYALPSNDFTTADSQCDDFIDLLQKGFGKNDYGDLFPVVDVETPTDKSISTETLVKWVDRFRKRFERKTRRRLMLYTGAFFVEIYDNFKLSDGSQPLKNMPLWIAMYTAIPGNPDFPPNVGGWTRWRMWQYTESEIVEGTGNPVDGNWGPNSVDLLTQPRNVAGLCAGRKGNMINICWSKNTDTDLLGYNLFANNYWIGTVDENDTAFSIKISQLPFTVVGPVKISIEAFDYDGETSKKRSTITV